MWLKHWFYTVHMSISWSWRKKDKTEEIFFQILSLTELGPRMAIHFNGPEPLSLLHSSFRIFQSHSNRFLLILVICASVRFAQHLKKYQFINDTQKRSPTLMCTCDMFLTVISSTTYLATLVSRVLRRGCKCLSVSGALLQEHLCAGNSY